MTDVELVVKMPEELYEKCKRMGDVRDTLYESIRKGIVLPKGHGDLIDRNKIAFDSWSVDSHECVWKQNVLRMSVVVPAEKVEVIMND